jgi:hypothetical protein
MSAYLSTCLPVLALLHEAKEHPEDDTARFRQRRSPATSRPP